MLHHVPRVNHRRQLKRRTPAGRSSSPRLRAAFRAMAVLAALAAGRAEAQAPALKLADLKVTAAKAWPQGTSTIALGGGIEVTVEHLDDYLTQHPDAQLNDFVLFLETRPLAGLDVRRVSVSGDGKDKLLFDLRSFISADGPASNEASWNKIMGSPPLCLGCRKKVAATTGLGNRP